MGSNDDDELKVKVEGLERQLAAMQLKSQAMPKSVAPPRFDGSVDFHEYLKKFNIHATAAGWQPADCARILPTLLDGEALQVYMNLPTTSVNTWAKLTSELAAGTSQMDPQGAARRALARAKMSVGETVNEFGRKIRNLVEKGMADDTKFSNEGREEMMKEYFIAGLPVEVKRKLFFMENPKSMEEAMKLAKKVIEVKKELQHESNVAAIDVEEIKAEVNAIKTKLNEREEEGRRRQTQKWTGNSRENRNWGTNDNRPWNNFNRWNGRGANRGQRQYRNANFQPLDQRQSENRKGNWRGRWQSNGWNQRGRVSGRGGGRQQYGVNLISSTNRSPSPIFPLLICTTILTIFAMPVMSQYQICSEKFANRPISLPNMQECEMAQMEKTVENEVTLYLPVASPKNFPIFACSRKTIEICTVAALWLYRDQSRKESEWKGIEVEECQSWVENREQNMTKIDECVWEVQKPEREEYTWIGQKCTELETKKVEKGEGGILSFELITSWGVRANPQKRFEKSARKTIIWEIPDESYWHTHIPTKQFTAETTGRGIVIAEIEAAFEFEEGDTDGVMGVPEGAIRLANDAFVVIHTTKEINETRRMKREKVAIGKKEVIEKQQARRKGSVKKTTIKSKGQNDTTTTAVTLTTTSTSTTTSTTSKPSVQTTITTSTTTTSRPSVRAKTTTKTAQAIASSAITTTISTITTKTAPTKMAKARQNNTIRAQPTVGTGRARVANATVPAPTVFHRKAPVEQKYMAKQSHGQYPTRATSTAASRSAKTFSRVTKTEQKKSGQEVVGVEKKGRKEEAKKEEEGNVQQIKKGINVNIEEPTKIRPEIVVQGQDQSAEESMPKPEMEREMDVDEEEEENSTKETEASEGEEEEWEEETANKEQNEKREKRTTTVITPMSEAEWEEKRDKAKQRMKFGQSMKNVNTRTNYALHKLNEEKAKEYEQIYRKACENSRFQWQLANAILKINPVEGMRELFERDDLVARWTVQGLEVGLCTQVSPDKIYWDRKIGNDECFESIPVKLGNSTLFLEPGSRDLVVASRKVDCNEEKEKTNVTENFEKEKQKLEEMLSVEKLKRMRKKNPLFLRTGAIYEEETSRIERALDEYKNRLNTLPTSMFRKMQSPSVPEAVQTVMDEFKEKAKALRESDMLKTLAEIPNKISEGWATMKTMAWIGIVALVVLIGGGILFLIVKTRIFWMAGFEVGRMTANMILSLIGRRRNEIKVAAVNDPNTQEAYILDYLPPRVYVIRNEPQKLVTIEGTLNGQTVRMLCDSCSAVSFCNESLAKKIGLQLNVDKRPTLSAANQSGMKTVGHTIAQLGIGTKKWEVNLLVVIDEHSPGEVLIGTPIMNRLKGCLNFEERKVKLGGEWTAMVAAIAAPEEKNLDVKIDEDVWLEPRSDTLLMAKIEEEFGNEVFLVNMAKGAWKDGLMMVGKTLVRPERTKKVAIRLLNAGFSPLKLYKNAKVAILEQICENEPGVFVTEMKEEYTPDEANWENKLPVEERMEGKISEKINFEGCRLSEEGKQRLKEIVDRNEEAFGKDGRIGKYRGPIVHSINLVPGSAPVRQRAYRIAPAQRVEVEKQLRKMLEQGIIQPSDSEFASPIVLVPKKDRTWRFAVDYRALNNITQKKVYHLPNIMELLDAIGSKRYYSTVDLCSGYHQIPIKEEDVPKTAFITHCGLYHFLRLPFGLASAPTTFQLIMESLRREITACMLCYLDDIIIGSMEEEEHLNDIENLLKIMKRAGLTLRIDKCAFAQESIKYLGFIVSEKGVKADPKQLETIQRFRKPRTLTELRSLVGALSYFRKFVPNFAMICHPLTALMKKEVEGKIEKNWNEEHEKALNMLKFLLLSPPVLRTARYDQNFEIETDASMVAIASVLIQEGHPILYNSRCLNKHERRYHVNELEALAITFAVKQYEPYILSAPKTTVFTDNSTLCAMMKAKGLSGRLLKYQMTLQSYQLEIKHRSGKSNKLADYMSRYLDWEEKQKKEEANVGSEIEREKGEDGKMNDEQRQQVVAIETARKSDLLEVAKENPIKITLQQIAEGQKKVKQLAKIYKALKWNQWPWKNEEKKKVRDMAKKCELINDAIFYKNHDGTTRLIIPYECRERILKEFHENAIQGGHMGMEKTYEKLKKRFYWEGMEKDTRTFVQACAACQHRKIAPGEKKVLPIKPIKPECAPFRRLHVDILGPLPETKKKNKYVLMTIDAFSKWVVASAMKKQDAASVCEAFVEDVVLKFGIPRVIVTDQGRQFMSELFAELGKLFGFEHEYTAPYHQSANGQIEVVNKIIGNIIACTSKVEDAIDWDVRLHFATFAYNTATHTTTKVAPFFTMFLREPKMPSDLMLRLPDGDGLMEDMLWQTQEMIKVAADTWKLVKDEIEKTQKEFKKKDDMQRKAEERNFEVGQLVLILKEFGKEKFGDRWNGPVRIVGIEQERKNLLVKSIDEKEKLKKVSMQKCKPYMESVLPLRPSDALLEKFVADPNIEESDEEEEENSAEIAMNEVGEQDNHLENEERNKNLSWNRKTGLESSDEEEEMQTTRMFTMRTEGMRSREMMLEFVSSGHTGQGVADTGSGSSFCPACILNRKNVKLNKCSVALETVGGTIELKEWMWCLIGTNEAGYSRIKMYLIPHGEIVFGLDSIEALANFMSPHWDIRKRKLYFTYEHKRQMIEWKLERKEDMASGHKKKRMRDLTKKEEGEITDEDEVEVDQTKHKKVLRTFVMSKTKKKLIGLSGNGNGAVRVLCVALEAAGLLDKRQWKVHEMDMKYGRGPNPMESNGNQPENEQCIKAVHPSIQLVKQQQPTRDAQGDLE